MNFFVTVESGLTSLTVEAPGKRLELVKPDGGEESVRQWQVLTLFVETQRGFYWTRDGDTRLVPAWVLHNAYWVCQDWLKQGIKKPVVIFWDQTEDLPNLNVRTHVVPTPRQDGRSGGRVGAPAQ